MPIVIRVTQDMFEFADVADYMVNPVNLMGVPGAGLALEFRRRVPSYVEPYQEACKSKELRIGTISIFEDTDQPWGIINLPTKRHYYDVSSPDDIARGLQALREMLLKDRYKYSTVGLPMLGCGLGKQDYSVVYPMMQETLGDLEATVFVSMAPDKTEMRPQYLTIAGPMDYGIKEDEQVVIDQNIQKVMEAWGTKIEDYTGIVSAGYPGVDEYVCGKDYLKDYENTFVFRKTGKPPLVVKPNEPKHGVAANLHVGNLLCEISEDIILFKPKGHNNNRLSAMQIWLQADKEKRERNGMFPRRLAVFGDVGTAATPDDILIPQIEDIPY